MTDYEIRAKKAYYALQQALSQSENLEEHRVNMEKSILGLKQNPETDYLLALLREIRGRNEQSKLDIQRAIEAIRERPKK